MLLSSDVEVDLSDSTITLSGNDKIYPKTENNPWKPDFENVILDRGRDGTVTAWSVRSLLFNRHWHGLRIKTDTVCAWKPDFENVILDRGRDGTVTAWSARSLLFNGHWHGLRILARSMETWKKLA